MKVGRFADFVIKSIMLFTTVIALMFFTQLYNPIVFWSLTWIFIIAIITKGVADIVEKR